MQNLWLNLLFLIGRYLHIVCTTLLVGGTLFYEMVVPIAIGELRTHEQLAIFARARQTFRSIVWGSALLLIASGVLTTRAHWAEYVQDEAPASAAMLTAPSTQPAREALSNADGANAAMRPGWWWAAHASTGVLAVIIAMGLTAGGRPPDRPVGWMRINLVVLLVVIFLAATTQQLRLVAAQIRPSENQPIPLIAPPTTAESS